MFQFHIIVKIFCVCLEMTLLMHHIRLISTVTIKEIAFQRVHYSQPLTLLAKIQEKRRSKSHYQTLRPFPHHFIQPTQQPGDASSPPYNLLPSHIAPHPAYTTTTHHHHHQYSGSSPPASPQYGQHFDPNAWPPEARTGTTSR